MSERRCKWRLCRKVLITARADAEFCGPNCKSAWHNEARRKQGATDKRLTDASATESHPIADVRAEQEAAKSHWSMIVREGILDVLRVTGAYHADDLDHLGIPDEHRNIIGAQTGGLVAGKWMVEVGRRKSINPKRHGAKSGIYHLTAEGRKKLAGVGSANREGTAGPSMPAPSTGRATPPGSHSTAARSSDAADPGEPALSLLPDEVGRPPALNPLSDKEAA